MKLLFILCLIFGSLRLEGQIYIDSYRFTAASTALLLDTVGGYPNASAAYSMRKLRTAYTGNCMTLRKTNGDTINIGFVNNYLDTATLKTQCGNLPTDTCWVRRLYDQSGNNVTMSQTTNSAQPTILVAGVMNKENNEVVIKFDGENDALIGSVLSAYITASTFSFTAVCNPVTITTNITIPFEYNDALWSDIDGWAGLHFRSVPLAVLGNYDNNGDVVTTSINTNTEYLFFGEHASGNLNFSKNNDANTTVASGNTGALNRTVYIARSGVNNGISIFTQVNFKELVFWKTSQNANKTGIINNIQDFYNIY